MIIGSGDIASALPQRDDLLFFASGVSNSQTTNGDDYTREINLLFKQDIHSHIVYFSSLRVLYDNSRYLRHKRLMEELIKKRFKKHTIIRVGNIAWGNNPHTIINFLKDKIKNGDSYTVQDTYRYIVDKEEFAYWIDKIPKWSCEMNITGCRMKVEEIVEGIKNGQL